jgi:hypothetical protein
VVATIHINSSSDCAAYDPDVPETAVGYREAVVKELYRAD